MNGVPELKFRAQNGILVPYVDLTVRFVNHSCRYGDTKLDIQKLCPTSRRKDIAVKDIL